MEKDKKSEVKLLNKNFRVTEKDVYEFNAWIKGKKIEPRLRAEFDSDNEYEDFMLDYNETDEFSVSQLPLDEPGTYQKGSPEYDFLDKITEAVYDQLVTELAKNGLKLEYDNLNDEFKVYSTTNNIDEVKRLGVNCGIYDKSTDLYKLLSSLDEARYNSLIESLRNYNRKLRYDNVLDQFVVTRNYAKSDKEMELLEPGNYGKKSDEYKYLDGLDEDEWIEYLDEMAKWGRSVEYNNVEDEFVVIGTEGFSNSGPDLGINSYIVVKLVAKKKDFDSYYFDIVSESHPWYDQISNLGINKSTQIGDWIVTRLSDDMDLSNATNNMTDLIENNKSFSDDGMTEVTFRTSNPEQLTKIVRAIGECGNGGHSFEIVIDPDYTKEEGGDIHLGWDGDGSDRIDLDSIKEFSEEREKVSAEMLKKAEEEGVVQKKPNGKWGIISIEAGEWWIPDYETKENAENALKAYHANKSERPDKEFSSKDLELTPDVAYALVAITMYDNPYFFRDLSSIDFDEATEMFSDAIKSVFPKNKHLLEKVNSVVHEIFMMANKNIESFNNN